MSKALRLALDLYFCAKQLDLANAKPRKGMNTITLALGNRFITFHRGFEARYVMKKVIETVKIRKTHGSNGR